MSRRDCAANAAASCGACLRGWPTSVRGLSVPRRAFGRTINRHPSAADTAASLRNPPQCRPVPRALLTFVTRRPARLRHPPPCAHCRCLLTLHITVRLGATHDFFRILSNFNGQIRSIRIGCCCRARAVLGPTIAHNGLVLRISVFYKG